jgi:hypothetical protein
MRQIASNIFAEENMTACNVGLANLPISACAILFKGVMENYRIEIRVY